MVGSSESFWTIVRVFSSIYRICLVEAPLGPALSNVEGCGSLQSPGQSTEDFMLRHKSFSVCLVPSWAQPACGVEASMAPGIQNTILRAGLRLSVQIVQNTNELLLMVCAQFDHKLLQWGLRLMWLECTATASAEFSLDRQESRNQYDHSPKSHFTLWNSSEFTYVYSLSKTASQGPYAFYSIE